jgi:D-3-phosphoglycerate dehydrogenase
VPAINGVKLISAENIAKMKDGVIFINTSRGNNVNEDDLLAALNSGKIRAAGLDVFLDEPTQNLALCAHPNVSCTPHLGGATNEAQGRIGMEIVEIIRSFAK